MNNLSAETDSNDIAQISTEASHSSKGELIVKAVSTAVTASIIIQSGKGVITTLAKHPFVMFSLGIVAGFFTHKYRKEILSITGKTAGQSKDFVRRQKANLRDLFAETRESADEQENQ